MCSVEFSVTEGRKRPDGATEPDSVMLNGKD